MQVYLNTDLTIAARSLYFATAVGWSFGGKRLSIKSLRRWELGRTHVLPAIYCRSLHRQSCKAIGRSVNLRAVPPRDWLLKPRLTSHSLVLYTNLRQRSICKGNNRHHRHNSRHNTVIQQCLYVLLLYIASFHNLCTAPVV